MYMCVCVMVTCVCVFFLSDGESSGKGPPGSSPAAAAHRPRGLPAGRSRVRGMSVCRRRPPAGLVGQRLSGSCGAAHPECEGWGQSRGPGEGSLGAVLRSRENRSEDPPGKPRPGGGLGTKHRRGPESRPQAARGSLPGGARRRAARRALAAPRARGLRSRRREIGRASCRERVSSPV